MTFLKRQWCSVRASRWHSIRKVELYTLFSFRKSLKCFEIFVIARVTLAGDFSCLFFSSSVFASAFVLFFTEKGLCLLLRDLSLAPSRNLLFYMWMCLYGSSQ
ncbi:hypothetical protein PVK06_006252 [Gossypium arboreum]|uniref:Uncharacterized protein n=1 Tax=Gossypium arboreum TaxID=29729 RepID=A0ABR0QX69_GOSAR|nr:hypothetical protein PVK06_006252 [Gossypium arboreum]